MRSVSKAENGLRKPVEARTAIFMAWKSKAEGKIRTKYEWYGKAERFATGG